MRAAVDADRPVHSPCRGIKLAAKPALERHVLTADELATLASAVGPDYEPMVWLGAVLGCAGASAPGYVSGVSTSPTAA